MKYFICQHTTKITIIKFFLTRWGWLHGSVDVVKSDHVFAPKIKSFTSKPYNCLAYNMLKKSWEVNNFCDVS